MGFKLILEDMKECLAKLNIESDEIATIIVKKAILDPEVKEELRAYRKSSIRQQSKRTIVTIAVYTYDILREHQQPRVLTEIAPVFGVDASELRYFNH